MQKALRIDQKLSLLDIPSLEIIDDLAFKREDVVICCAGFEDRALSVLNSAISSGDKYFFLILISYLPFVQENRDEDIKKFCEDNNIKMHNIIYDRENPYSIGENILLKFRTPEMVQAPLNSRLKHPNNAENLR